MSCPLMKNLWPNILVTGLSIVLALCMGTASFAQDAKPAPAIKTQTPRQISKQPSEQPPEQPPWQVCNETSFVLDIATAGVPAGQSGAPISVRGWQALRPGQCKTVDVEKGTPRFVYARSAALHQGGVREWKGRYDYCVGAEDFTAKADISCELQNMSSAKFLQVVPTQSRTVFTEPDDFNRRAETAGLQRLLRDNNYELKRIDGQSGKRTSNALNKFLKAQKLSPSISMTEKFDALERRALETRKSIGVRFCNKSTARMWSALAYKTAYKTQGAAGGGYEARGWWPIEKGSCIQPFTENLKDRDVHFYVRQEMPNTSGNAVDAILKVSASTGKLFCVGPSKFSSLHHEFCEDQGYIAARFKPVLSDKPGTKIDLANADFTSALVSGLR